MSNILSKLQSFVSDFSKSEEGVTAVEYGLIAAGIAIAIVTVVGVLGNSISATFQSIVTKL